MSRYVLGLACVECARTNVQIIAVRRCNRCYIAHRDFGPRFPCSRCCRCRPLWDGTGMCSACIHFSARLRNARPTRTCASCGLDRRIATGDTCINCYHSDPGRPAEWLARLGQRVELPGWFDDFSAFVLHRWGPYRAMDILRVAAYTIRDGGPATERSVLLRIAASEDVASAAALEAFLVSQRKMFRADTTTARAAIRRTRRVEATPPGWRRDVADFAVAIVAHRERAGRRGTYQVSDRRIEHHIGVLRDFARWCITTRRASEWSNVSTADIEAFVSNVASTRTAQLDAMRAFYRWARKHRRVLADPASSIKVMRNHAHVDVVISRSLAQSLVRRWTTNLDVHPHEAFIGLMTMLHGASTTELRHSKISDVNVGDRSIQLGSRPGPTVLDPYCWAALERVVTIHEKHVAVVNQHLLASGHVKTHTGPPSQSTMSERLHGGRLGVNSRTLRSAHLGRFVEGFDPVLVAAAHGITAKAALYYQGDRIDTSRTVTLDDQAGR